MALVKCGECGAQISSDAESCPKCGYKQPKPTSTTTWVVGILLVLTIGMCVSSQVQEESAKQEQAKATQARLAAMTPEQRKAEDDRRAREQQEKRRADEAVNRATVGAQLLKKSMNNPDSFKLESALVIANTGAVCYEFRGQNAFGAIVRGEAVLSSDSKKFLTNTDKGFTRLWNTECAGKSGTQAATAIRWFAL